MATKKTHSLFRLEMARKKTPSLFADAPSFMWELKSDPRQMVREHVKLMKWIDKLLKKHTIPFEYFDGHKRHTRPKTSEIGLFFKIIMRTSEDFLRPGQKMEDLILIFSLYDLYLLGFLHNNVWYLFDDAKLDGSGHLSPEHAKEWIKLDFKGSHSVKVFYHDIGVLALHAAHETLCNPLQRANDVIKAALMTIAIVISEAKRFYEFLQFMLEMFGRGLSISAGDDFLFLFQKWSKTSKQLLKDPLSYEPQHPSHPTYISAVKGVLVVRASEEETTTAPYDEAAHAPVWKYIKDYDLTDPQEYELMGTAYHKGRRSKLLQMRRSRRRNF